MKSCSIALQAHLQQEVTTLAWLWKITRADGTVLAFTTFDSDIPYDGVTYEAATGFVPSAAESKSDLSVDNMQVSAFLDADAITSADIRGLLYEGADIEIRIVNWADLTMGDLKIRKGDLGTLSMANELLTAEIRGITQRLAYILGATYGVTCRAELFSDGVTIGVGQKYLCRLSRIPYVQSGSVASCPDRSHIVPVVGLAQNPPHQGPFINTAGGQTGDGFSWIDGLGGSGGTLSGVAFYFQHFDTSLTGATQKLQVKTYGFSLPVGATIVGIKVFVDRWNQFNTAGGSHGHGSCTIVDGSVRLMKAGVAVGANRASNAKWGLTQETAGYGSSGDLWGTTWSLADVANAGFGVEFIADVTQSDGGFQGWVGNIKIVVYYTGGGSPTPAPAGWFNNGFLQFTSGALINQKFDVRFWDGTTLTIFPPMMTAALAGDTFEIEPGCAKTLEDCRDKFDNVINRQAEDFIAGNFVVLNYPDAKAPTQVTS